MEWILEFITVNSLVFIVSFILLFAIYFVVILPKQIVLKKCLWNATDKLKLEWEIRRIIGQQIAGLFILMSLVIAWRTYISSSETQLSERFSNAIELIGSELSEVRTGGIYVLESISRTSDDYYWITIEFLATYVREKSPLFSVIAIVEKDGDVGIALDPTFPEIPVEYRIIDNKNEYKAVNMDIQACMKVIGQRKKIYENNIPRYIDLIGAWLPLLQLPGSNLQYLKLQRALLHRAGLENSDLSFSDLRGATLSGANLSSANLTGCKLSRYNWAKENVDYLSRTLMHNTILKNADLRGTDLRNVLGLQKSQIEEAIIDSTTQIPDYLNP